MKGYRPGFLHEQCSTGILAGSFEAAALFIDLAGFTSLSEILMRESAANAEELAEALDQVFGPIVDEIYTRGGFVPLFPGDGVLAIFPAPESEETTEANPAALHALATARFGQQVFGGSGEASGSKDARRRPLDLKARFGLSWGEVVWAALDTQDEPQVLYFRGPAISRCSAVQRAAGVGQVVVDEHFRDRMGPRLPMAAIEGTSCCVVSSDPTSAFLPFPEAESSAELRPATRSPDSSTDGSPTAEFRDICPVFISFREADGPEMDAFIGDAALLVSQYGGSLNQVEFNDEGGLIVALFGAPVAQENVIERALGFLSALERGLRSVAWRAGVSFGRVWAGMRGGRERRAYGALGDVMNQAARLALRASWGEAWATDAVQHPLEPLFRFEPVGTLTLKGRDEPSHIYRLGGRRDTEQGVRYTTSFFGRSDDLARLVESVTDALEHTNPAIVYIHGEAGIGKSRLVFELRDQLRDTIRPRWLTCQVDQTLRQALNPFRYLLSRYFQQESLVPQSTNLNRFNRILNELMDSLPDPRGEPIRAELRRTRSFLGALIDLRWEGSLYEQVEPRLRRDNTFMAVHAFLSAQALLGPTLLHIEDTHWIDDDSQQVIRQLLRNAQGFPLVLVMTCRPLDGGQRLRISGMDGTQEVQIELMPLTDAVATSLARNLLDGDISPALSDLLSQKCSGNPFFIEQLLLDLQERQALVREHGQWTLSHTATDAVPPTIGAVLTARIDRLASDVKTVVQTAAVLGREFEVRVLSRMLKDIDGLPQRVDDAAQSRVWRPLSELRYIYLHALLRDAAYDMQVRSRLRQLHRLAGEAIEHLYADGVESHYDDLAHHFFAAADSDRGAAYARSAGDRAVERSAYREAARILSRGIELLERAEASSLEECRADLYRLRGTAHQRMSEYGNARGDYGQSMEISERLGDSSRIAEALNGAGFVAFSQGDYPTARHCYERALSLAGDSDRVKAATLGNMGRLEIVQGNYQSGAEHLQASLLLRERLEDRVGDAASLLSLGTCAAYRGDRPTAVGCFERSLQLSRDAGSPQGVGASLNALGNMAYFAGDYATAETHFRQSADIMRDIGDRLSLAAALNNLGGLHYSTSDYQAALSEFEESLGIKRLIGDRAGIADTLGNIGGTYSELGQMENAETYLAECIELKRELGDRRGTALNLGNLARAKLALGKDGEAAQMVHEALTTAREIGAIPDMLFVLVPAVLLMIRHGETHEAAVICGQLIQHDGIHAQARQRLEQILQDTGYVPGDSTVRSAGEGIDVETIVSSVLATIERIQRPEGST